MPYPDGMDPNAIEDWWGPDREDTDVDRIRQKAREVMIQASRTLVMLAAAHNASGGDEIKTADITGYFQDLWGDTFNFINCPAENYRLTEDTISDAEKAVRGMAETQKHINDLILGEGS